jgi:hypothetical protein
MPGMVWQGDLACAPEVACPPQTPPAQASLDLGPYCLRPSRRGLVQEDKRMAFVYTHGLFIT